MTKVETYTSDELIDCLVDLRGSIKYRSITRKQRFTEEEVVFISNMIFHRPYKNIIFALADFLEESYFMGMKLINSANFRRLIFFKAFFARKGNSTKAAIDAGYSPKSAKQQGHRTLRWIQSRNND